MKSRRFFYLCLSLGWMAASVTALAEVTPGKPPGRFAKFNGKAQAGMEIEMDKLIFAQIISSFEIADPVLRAKYASLTPAQLLDKLFDESHEIRITDLQVKDSAPTQVKQLLNKFEWVEDSPAGHSVKDLFNVVEFRHKAPERDLDQYQADVENFCRFVAGPDPVAQEKLIARLSDAHSRVNGQSHFNYHVHSSTLEPSNQKERARGLQMLTTLDFMDRPDLQGEVFAFKSRNSAYTENIWEKGLWRLIWLDRTEERKRLIPAADSLERTLHYQTMEQIPAEHALREEIARRLGSAQLTQLTENSYSGQIPALLDMIKYISVEPELTAKVAPQFKAEHLQAITRYLSAYREFPPEGLGQFYEFVVQHPFLRKLTEQTTLPGKTESLFALLQKSLRRNFQSVLVEGQAENLTQFIEQHLHISSVQQLFSDQEIDSFKKLLNQKINEMITMNQGHNFYEPFYLSLLDSPGSSTSWLDPATAKTFRKHWLRAISTFDTHNSGEVVYPLMQDILTDPRALRALNDHELQLITHNFLAEPELDPEHLDIFYHNVLAQPRYDSERLRGYRTAGQIIPASTRELALTTIARKIHQQQGACTAFDLLLN